MKFGERLITIREQRNITQDELAEQLGVSAKTIYRWEHDISYPDIKQLKAISALFDVSVAYLLNGEEESPCAETATTEIAVNETAPPKKKIRAEMVAIIILSGSLLCMIIAFISIIIRLMFTKSSAAVGEMPAAAIANGWSENWISLMVIIIFSIIAIVSGAILIKQHIKKKERKKTIRGN